MSDTDSFIDEVNEEVRRDKLFAALRRYGWIAALAVVAIVGAASWNEYRKAQAQTQAEAVGDALLRALNEGTPGARLTSLEEVPANAPGSEAVTAFLAAAQAQEAGDLDAAVSALDTVAVSSDLPEIYRQLATFKTLILQSDSLPSADLRQGFEALARPGAPLDLLAREQLALLSLREGDTDMALQTYEAILNDAAVSSGLQQRALQVIVALGGTPDLQSLVQPGLDGN